MSFFAGGFENTGSGSDMFRLLFIFCESVPVLKRGKYEIQSTSKRDY